MTDQALPQRRWIAVFAPRHKDDTRYLAQKGTTRDLSEALRFKSQGQAKAEISRRRVNAQPVLVGSP